MERLDGETHTSALVILANFLVLESPGPSYAVFSFSARTLSFSAASSYGYDPTTTSVASTHQSTKMGMIEGEGARMRGE